MGKGLLDKDHLNASQFGGSFWDLTPSELSYQWIITSCGRALQLRLKVLLFNQKQL